MENIVYNTLRKKYRETKNIYESVKRCKKIAIRKRIKHKNELERTLRREERERRKIEYYGEKLLLSAIARREQIVEKTLIHNFEKTGNIYEAIKITKQNTKSKREEKENSRATLVAKYEEQKGKKVETKGTTINLYDMSILIGIEYRDLLNLLNSGISISEIKERQVGQDFGNKTRFENKEILLEFCIQKKLDFAFIYRAVFTYKKKLSEAVYEWENGNKQIPISWISEKFNNTLGKLGYTGLQSMAIVNDLHSKNITLEEAIEMCIIRKIARKNGISPDLGDILYTISRGRKLLGDDFQSEIQLNEDEKVFINECEEELTEIKRKIQEDASSTLRRKDEDDKIH